MCGGPKWKREEVPDHKFDFVDTREFRDNGFLMRMKYLWLYLIVLKSFLVYISDIFSAVTMLSTKTWSNEIFRECETKDEKDGCVYIPFEIGKWLFVGCIIFGFLLLAYESRKAKKIIASRDISFAFTNVMANNYYSLRSYDHFCFFDHISNSTKTSDDFAFFIFFVFKSWKRVILSDGPRQTINALTLYAVWLVNRDNGPWYDVTKYFRSSLSTSALTVTTFFTVVVFAGSLLLLVVAGLCYIPLLCYIRGNLKEYCCHIVDKRIEEVIAKRRKQRLQDAAKAAQKEAMGDYSHLKNKKGDMIATPLPQPTLPNLSVDDDDETSSVNTKIPAPSTYTQDYYGYHSDKASYAGDYPPPMPAYNPYSRHQAPGSYAQFNPSVPALDQDYQYTYEEDNASTVHLAAAGAPFAHYQSPIDRPGSSAPSDYATPARGYETHDMYQAHQPSRQDSSRRWTPPGSESGQLAYNEPDHFQAGSQAYRGQSQMENPYTGYSSNAVSPNVPSQGQQGYYDNRGQGL